MARSYTYACADYPGMEACPGKVTASTEAEVMALAELHAAKAHGEDPSAWSDEDRTFVKNLIKPD